MCARVRVRISISIDIYPGPEVFGPPAEEGPTLLFALTNIVLLRPAFGRVDYGVTSHSLARSSARHSFSLFTYSPVFLSFSLFERRADTSGPAAGRSDDGGRTVTRGISGRANLVTKWPAPSFTRWRDRYDESVSHSDATGIHFVRASLARCSLERRHLDDRKSRLIALLYTLMKTDLIVIR